MNSLPKIEPITTKLLPAPKRLTPDLQNAATLANLMAYIDGSTARACLECGEIFIVTDGSARMRCEPCQCKAEEGACCDSPDPQPIRVQAGADAAFATLRCSSCGHSREVEL